MKIEIEDADIDRIAEAVAKKLGDKAPAAPATTSAPETGKSGKGKKVEEKPEESPEAIQKRRGEVLAKVKALGEKAGREVAKGIVQNYAPTMGEVKPGDFDALEAELDKALKDADKPKDADDDY